MIAQITQQQCYTFNHDNLGYCIEMYFYRVSLDRMFKAIQRREYDSDIKPESQFHNMRITYKRNYTIYSFMDTEENYILQIIHRSIDNSVVFLTGKKPVTIYL